MRLREERNRLSLSQQDVADLCEVHRKTVLRWESEIAIPADVLSLLARNGFDTQYVITGVRSNELDRIAEARAEYQDAPLSREEWKWVHRYRALSDAQRAQAQAMLDVIALGAAAPTQTIKGRGHRVAGRDYLENAMPKKR